MTRILGWLSGWWRGFVKRHIVDDDQCRVEALERVFAEMQNQEMPELADTHYSVWHIFEFTDGNVIFAAPTDADAAAYLICRSAREAVS